MEKIIKPLLKTIKMGDYDLRNRVAMAALTRCRADPNLNIPNELHVQYYTERAENAGFILTECAAISKNSLAFSGCCGIFSDAQVEGWIKVCDSVHEVNGRIFLQIWHGGRSVHPIMADGELPICPSSIKNRHKARVPSGYVDNVEPIEMRGDDIKRVLNDFHEGAKNAKRAGFDGVQLHGANGYLIDSFLRDGVNKRTDEYGGSIENRCRFPLEVIDALIDVFGAGKVGMKISPVGRLNDMFDSDPISLYTYLLQELDKRNVGHVEIMRAPEFKPVPNYYGIEGIEQIPDMYKTFRPHYKGTLIANNKFDFETGNQIIQDGDADMVTFGRLYISNPDLVQRFQNDWVLNEPNEKTFYTPGPEGYTDYPTYENK